MDYNVGDFVKYCDVDYEIFGKIIIKTVGHCPSYDAILICSNNKYDKNYMSVLHSKKEIIDCNKEYFEYIEISDKIKNYLYGTWICSNNALEMGKLKPSEKTNLNSIKLNLLAPFKYIKAYEIIANDIIIYNKDDSELCQIIVENIYEAEVDDIPIIELQGQLFNRENCSNGYLLLNNNDLVILAKRNI